MTTNFKDIESRLSAIEERNKKVERDKAWEVSWTRRVSIMALTYVVAEKRAHGYCAGFKESVQWLNLRYTGTFRIMFMRTKF